MPIRRDRDPWTPEEDAHLTQCFAVHGMPVPKAHAQWPPKFPKRSLQAIRMRKQALGVKTEPNGSIAQKGVEQPVPVTPEQEVEQRETQDGMEAKSYGRRIKTVADLLKHIEADLTKFEVSQSEATKNEQVVRDADDKIRVVEYHRVFVRLKPKVGLNAEELVRAVVAGAMKPRKAMPFKYVGRQNSNVLQGIVIADPHIGKYSWHKETGDSDYDISIAVERLRDATNHLIIKGKYDGVERRDFWLLGDVAHYDTPNGQTTGGTPLERDGRADKMIAEASAVLFDLIEHSAKDCETRVILVPGNHDALLTIAFRHILAAHFRHDDRVTVDVDPKSRKYVEWGKCLIGLTHGDKARKNLHTLMASEASEAWGRTTYREIHHGHLHSEGEVQTVITAKNEPSVIVRQHRALCPPDGWHSQEGFVGTFRGMGAYYYHKAGALVQTVMANPEHDMR